MTSYSAGGNPGVVRVPNPARRLGTYGGIPLAVRWKDMQEKIRDALPPNHPLQSAGNDQMSEIGLDNALDALEAELKAQAEKAAVSPEVIEASREVRDLERQWNSCCLAIKAAQGWLKLARNNWRHILLDDIGPDCFLVPRPTEGGSLFSSSFEARQYAKDLQPKVLWAKGVATQIAAAQSFEKQPRDEQSLALLEAMMAHKIAADNRIRTLTDQVAALKTRLDGIERKAIRKRKNRTRSKAKKETP